MTDRFVSVAEPIIGEEERENINRVLDSGRFLQGPLVEEFEKKWADYVGTKHAIAVSNGTTAIQLSLNALGLEPGDEVIVPSLTFGSTATAVVHQACVPVFADIDREIYTLDHTDLERCLSDRTEAILPVHLYGHPAEMDKIRSFADEHDLAIVEDAAQAHGASYKGDPVGSIGDVGCFSFYATKNITTGEGGIVTTDDDDIAESIRLLRSHGMANRDEHVSLGYNYRMSELNGAIGSPQVDRLPDFNRRRTEITERLFAELDDLDWIRPATVRDYVDHAYFWAPFELDTTAIGMSGKEVWKKLKEQGVETRHRYVDPLYKQPVFTEHRGFNSDFPWSANEHTHDYGNLSLPNVEAVAGKTIGLPNHPGLDDEEVDYVIETVRGFDS
ncbi:MULTISPECIES: DegT/DnrJ/EryC1/StrS aminotransferase family protein [Haloferax]|nr:MULTISPECIES: DegT/DnrJ/EryC1/StrS family aminotransferase [Haloferax]